jgi:serine/threonine protein kinase
MTTIPAASDPMLNTTVLGRYRIVRRLASGGMGAVYLGRTEGAQGFTRPVVIKRVLPTLMGDREVAQLFVREAQILSNLQHPSIVSVLDFGQQDDDAYVMVLEYVHGYQVAEWMRFLRRTSQTMPVDFALHIMIRVLDALHYAHTYQRSDGAQLRIIHRDVSPSNVLLSDTGIVKLLDFGIARVSGDETSFRTEKPRVRGKMPYLALEIFKGEEPNERSDLYSAGVVLFEMLAGFNPFHGRETADIYFKILNTSAPSVHAGRDDAPEDLDQVIARALAKDPAERYASASEFAAALRALRSAPEEVVTQRLSERLRADFGGPMQTALGIEPLASRETAWRTAERPASDSVSDFTVAHEGDITDSGTEPNGAVTVQLAVQPELLVAAARTDTSFEPAAPPLSPVPTAQPAAAISMQRIAIVVVLAAIVGAISAGGLWMLVADGGEPEPVVVIEREVRAPQAQAQPRPTPAVPLPITTDAAVAAEPSEAQTPSDKPEETAALPPNPKRLTRAFGRRQKLIEECFSTHAKELQGQPQIAVHFRIGTRGQVLEAALSPEPLAGTALGRCVLGVARAASFGPQQIEVAFRIPITAQKLSTDL